MQSMGLGERLLYAAPHSLKNVAVAGTTGILTAMGASGAARSIATVAPLSSSSTVSQGIGRVNAARQEAAQAYETSTALQDANQALGAIRIQCRHSTSPSLDVLSCSGSFLDAVACAANSNELLPNSCRERGRIHIITVQQYQALARSPAAQAEFAENYKGQLESIVEYDASGNSDASKPWSTGKSERHSFEQRRHED